MTPWRDFMAALRPDDEPTFDRFIAALREVQQGRAQKAEEGNTGERWDVGFGFGRRLDLPFTWGHPNLRTYIAKPVGEGSEGRGWRFLVAFEK